MTRVYLSLGSNIGDRRDYLNRAITALSKLPKTQLIEVSSLYETPAWGLTDQDDFFNLCCELETQLKSQELLGHCQRIEKELDRVRNQHWGPRTLDIDILLFGEEVIDTEVLKIPHPYMTQRAFVLVPLLELDPDLRVKGEKLSEKLLQLDTSHIVKV
ncbi:MAG: 2-amino-4-hydroxy-6-hydroxymethyldihydropteridine diphosphokinase [Streptococcus orisratti]|uniref:2-amino-4-hydroxy-6- hydroxymethyldihydropteridine diphosphokinase n=2 Tax=Streptococcus orisratti TaxID=114652 RepID=UPI002352BFE7|nr:2-amino-4-hydroxy-6-hydroxymethyldihydropteridine diphosphokinase [Streptococcus orisratti]MCI7676604.1 2-amino-4-hydroxy-6-hydroxymethyldihydropteridine diphosphokinase [Streptococcus orisratti]MDY4002435.1 2-amino-4-hydroxy-6-hydroxymethyldihydropteridine diphosphokinase [Streptococcus orisratti]